jgi:acid phosphatase/tartrate-resistant acid phosphatase type 5
MLLLLSGLEERMETSTADYLWVGGHYPVWAIGQDPPTGVRQILRDLLNKWEANYFNGHEHDFEHIVEDGSKVNYVSTVRFLSNAALDWRSRAH